jgi:hypothetical protein
MNLMSIIYTIIIYLTPGTINYIILTLTCVRKSKKNNIITISVLFTLPSYKKDEIHITFFYTAIV